MFHAMPLNIMPKMKFQEHPDRRRHPDVGLVSCAPGIAATARMGLANLKAQHQIGPVLIHNGLWRNGGHRNYPHNALKRSRTLPR